MTPKQKRRQKFKRQMMLKFIAPYVAIGVIGMLLFLIYQLT